MSKNQFLMLAAFVMCSILFSNTVGAKVWRVNNNAGVHADFTELSTALSSASVQIDDTLYIEGSATNYAFANMSKRLVIIGTGYLLSGTGSNTGLQYNPYPAHISNLDLDSSASGSTFIGVSGYLRFDSRTDDLKFIRSSVYLDPLSNFPNSTAKNWVINKCIIGTGYLSFHLENLQVTNCLSIYSGVYLPNVTNGLFRNNVFAVGLTTVNSYVSNNIFLNQLSLTNCTVKYNISTGNNLPAGNNNMINVHYNDIFVESGTTDGRYQLKSGSVAIGAGEPINGVTPDIGAFGTADPYRLSGIPPIPTIYTLSVPASVPATATSITITFSTRSNN